MCDLRFLSCESTSDILATSDFSLPMSEVISDLSLPISEEIFPILEVKDSTAFVKLTENESEGISFTLRLFGGDVGGLPRKREEPPGLRELLRRSGDNCALRLRWSLDRGGLFVFAPSTLTE
jgi:hypothetical protein